MDRTPIQAILALSRTQKRVIAVGVDSALCALTVLIAFYLRFGSWVWPTGLQWFAVVGSVLFAIPLFITFGLYRAIFRYAGWPALMAVVRAIFIYGLVYSLVFTFVGVSRVPRTVGLIQPILLFIAIGGVRAIARYWLGGGYETLLKLGQRPKVLIYGAGTAGRQLAAAMANNDVMNLVGFLDDDQALQGRTLSGKTIYSPENVQKIVARLGVSDILLAIPSVSRKRRNEILEAVRSPSVVIRTLPGVMELAQGHVTTNDLRELDLEDLLGRDAVSPDEILLGINITGKSVMVTGAGGSIGSELCRQILLLNPARLLLIEMSEFALYNIHHELTERLAIYPHLATQIVPVLGLVQDDAHMRSEIGRWQPETIYHTAAYKHVPLVEENPLEGVRNNVFGTVAMAQAASDTGVRNFVLISTDKAVRPTNVMGASKRIAEMVLQALHDSGSKTRFSMVRFGNVLGSSGSVVPLFRKQIRDGGPITITHEEVTRYFMTIPEAAQLVLQASTMAIGGDVFVLDMGDPVKIIDLARKMTELSGLTVSSPENPDGDIQIVVTGLRPGEKLYEELLIGNNPGETSHPRIKKANEQFLPWEELSERLSSLAATMSTRSTDDIRNILKTIVPEYVPSD